MITAEKLFHHVFTTQPDVFGNPLENLLPFGGEELYNKLTTNYPNAPPKNNLPFFMLANYLFLTENEYIWHQDGYLYSPEDPVSENEPEIDIPSFEKLYFDWNISPASNIFVLIEDTPFEKESTVQPNESFMRIIRELLNTSIDVYSKCSARNSYLSLTGIREKFRSKYKKPMVKEVKSNEVTDDQMNILFSEVVNIMKSLSNE